MGIQKIFEGCSLYKELPYTPGMKLKPGQAILLEEPTNWNDILQKIPSNWSKWDVSLKGLSNGTKRVNVDFEYSIVDSYLRYYVTLQNGNGSELEGCSICIKNLERLPISKELSDVVVPKAIIEVMNDARKTLQDYLKEGFTVDKFDVQRVRIY